MDYRVEDRADKRPWSPEELAAIEEETLVDHVRGAAPRYWEEVEEEEVMSTAAYGPLRVVEISLTGCYTDSGAINGGGVAHSGGQKKTPVAFTGAWFPGKIRGRAGGLTGLVRGHSPRS